MNQDNNDSSLDTSSYPTQSPNLFQNFALLGGFSGLNSGFNNLNGFNNTYIPSPDTSPNVESELRETQAQSNRLEDDNNELVGENTRLREEIIRLNNLLKQPLREIAQQDADFAKNYYSEKELLATWMASQKAFQELAIQLGEANGLTHTEIVKKGLSMVNGVLLNEYSSSHGTNATDPFLQFYKEKLLEKFPINDKETVIGKIDKIRESAIDNTTPRVKNQF